MLSGFLLTRVHKPQERAGAFYWGRGAGIWPATLVAAVPASLVVYVMAVLRPDWGSIVASLFLVQTWLPHTQPTLPGNPVTWTLSVELALAVKHGWRIRLHPAVPVLALCAYTYASFQLLDHLPTYWALQLSCTERPVLAVLAALIMLAFTQREIRGHHGLLVRGGTREPVDRAPHAGIHTPAAARGTTPICGR